MIPLISVQEHSLAEAWVTSIRELISRGVSIPTEYNEESPSLDCMAAIRVEDPFREPRIPRFIPSGLDGLIEYTFEVCFGTKDNLVGSSDTAWTYTYHQRLFDYSGQVNQISYMLEKLTETPYTRRAIAITWNPFTDIGEEHPACFVAGTRVSTPLGDVNIEDIENGNIVYGVDLDTGELEYQVVSDYFTTTKECVRVSTHSHSIDVSNGQLLLTKTGWKSAESLTADDSIAISALGSHVTDMMVFGFLHGDGWLSGSFCSNSNKRPRYELGFSLHPDSDSGWLYQYLKHSLSVPKESERFVSSDIVVNGGRSRKIMVGCKALWLKFAGMGAPIGPKNKDLELEWDADDLTDDECSEFLTGLFSAEGCVTRQGGNGSVQIGMMCKSIIDVVESIFNRLGIDYRRYLGKSGVHTLAINTIDGLRSAIDAFDFRMDSRKQIKWLILKESISYSDVILFDRAEQVRRCLVDSKSLTIRELKAKYPKYNSRWIKDNYAPSFRFKEIPNVISNNCVFFPVNSVVNMGQVVVYDFTVDSKDHAIVANSIIAHNCLQNIFARLLDCGDFYSLEMAIHIRSNDALMAAYMNQYAFIYLQWLMSLELSCRLKKRVVPGSYTHFANSYHIYGSRRDDGSVWRFLEMGSSPYLVRDDTTEILYEAMTQQYNKYQDIIDNSIFSGVLDEMFSVAARGYK